MNLLKDPAIVVSLIGMVVILVVVGLHVLTPFTVLIILFLIIALYASLFSKKQKKQYSKKRFVFSPILALFIVYPASLGIALWYDGNSEIYPLHLFMLYGYSMTVLIVAIVMPLSLYLSSITKLEEDKNISFPPISIIIPAYNEEKVIESCIKSALSASYPTKKEIVAIDNCSQDDTYKILTKYANKIIIGKESTKGKSFAINNGIAKSNGDIIIVIDADTIIEKKGLRNIIKPFINNPNVGAVSGNVKIQNVTNIHTKIQVLEYAVSMQISRGILGLFGIVPVVSGAFGAFRRTTIIQNGYNSAFTNDTLTEDFDATITILKRGYTTQFNKNALAYTEAPQTLKDYIRQRFRWYRGFLQGYIKHADFFINPKHGYVKNLGFFLLINAHIIIPINGIVNIIAIIPATILGNWLIFGQLIILNFLIMIFYFLASMKLSDDKIDKSLMWYYQLHSYICAYSIMFF